MVAVHRQLVYWDNETIYVTVSVVTPDMDLTMSVKNYVCDLNKDKLVIFSYKRNPDNN